jgi:signal peptidase I
MRALLIVGLALLVAGCGGSHHKKRTVRVPNGAMRPTYAKGNLAVVDLDAYGSAKPRRGDVVLFHPPQGETTARCGDPSQPADGQPCERPSGGPVYPRALMMRVVAVAGDWIEVRGNRVYLARSAAGPFTRQREPFAKARPCDPPLCNLAKPIQVRDGSYFLMGDNRDRSDDSRHWGPVPFQWIDGKVVATET